ncbi:hypothetical protein HW090_03360 [Pseudomonas sp. ABC1]|uniref:hypothetical protein n=1 Tax=Pseudomonas sp. ABC1 TaxID=2748080 RepID=UPI0015C3CDA7|nr:hypothetical protein [Pseudomonas sp. ABC1]QLF92290.1 hypothetical protein HW090_03360 [Pseudomonas sp. ABC1]
MSNLTRLAEKTGNDLVATGIGLETISNLLCADGREYRISAADLNGLHHAALALAAYVKAMGYDLAIAVETMNDGGVK